MRCAAITRSGERCKTKAMDGYEHCYSHRPDLAQERRKNAKAGGRAGGRGRSSRDEVEQAKNYAKNIVTRLLRDDIPRDIATAAFAGLHVVARLIELERKIHAEDELEARIEVLERKRRVEQAAWPSRGRRS